MSDKPSPAEWVTVGEMATMLGLSRYDDRGVVKLAESAGITYERFGRNRRYISAADADRLVRMRAGLRETETTLDRIATLQSELDQLREEARSWNETLALARDEERMTAERALGLLGLDRCLEILGRIEEEQEPRSRHWRAALDARERVIAQMDRRDAPSAVGQRPARVPERAMSKTIATAIGLVDLWYWTRPNGNYDSFIGGPRPQRVWNGSGGSRRDAIKVARHAAVGEYGKPTRQSSARLRFLILERDEFTCRYCGRKAPDVELHVDHAVSIADGGPDAYENLVTACQECNLGKSGRSIPVERWTP